MNLLGGIFTRGNTLDRIKSEDLRGERVRLQVQEQTLAKRLRELEAQKGKMFKNAVSAGGNKAEDRIAARQIHSLRSKQNDLERQAEDISNKLMALERVTRMKERQGSLEEKGVWAKISEMNIEDLNEALLGTNVQDQEQRNLVGVINETLGIDEATLAAQESPDIANILEHIEAARESGMVEDELGSMERLDSDALTER